jgi:type IV pilus assembly protein PilB
MALMEGKKTGMLLGEVLQNLDWVTEEQLQMAIAVQSGAKILDLDNASVNLGLLAEIPQEFIDTHHIFPIEVENGILKAATTNPFDVVAKEKLSRLTGYKVETYLAPKDWISKSIEVHYKTAMLIDNSIEQLTGYTEQSVEEENIV